MHLALSDISGSSTFNTEFLSKYEKSALPEYFQNSTANLPQARHMWRMELVKFAPALQSLQGIYNSVFWN